MERLACICAAEGVAIDRQALQALAARCRCDVRACLNTLQLLARQQAGRRGAARGAGRITAWQVGGGFWGDAEAAYSHACCAG